MKKNMFERKKIWDLSLRLFHVTLIILVICLIISAKYDRLDIHQYFGVALLGLIFFRVFLGFFGTYYSRFKSFNLSPKQALIQFTRNYNNNSVRTPLGSFSTLIFIITLLILSVSGLFSSDDILYDGPLSFLAPNYVDLFTYIHNKTHFILYFLIAIHLLAIFYYQIFKKEKIIQRIFDGYSRINKIEIDSIHDKPLKGILLLFLFIFLPILILKFF